MLFPAVFQIRVMITSFRYIVTSLTTTPPPTQSPNIHTTLSNSGLSKKPTKFTFPKIHVNAYLPWQEEVLPQSLLLNPQNQRQKTSGDFLYPCHILRLPCIESFLDYLR